MKKYLIFFMFLITICVTGCTRNLPKLVKQNMSEIAYVAYQINSEEFSCNVTYGERETDYELNGKSTESIDYCLVTFCNYDEDYELSVLDLPIYIDDEKYDCLLERNPFTLNYMIDLAIKLEGDEKIKLIWNDNEFLLEKKEFEFDYDDVISKVCIEYEKVLKSYVKNGKLKAECYLKLLDMKQSGLENEYWCFTILDEDNTTYICLIDTTTGEISLKD